MATHPRNSWRISRTEEPSGLQSTGLHRVGYDWTANTFTFSGHQALSLCSIAQLCLTLCDLLDCSLPGSSVHGILQARILEWVATSSSRGSSQPRDRTRISCVSTAGGFFTTEPPGTPHYTSG